MRLTIVRHGESEWNKLNLFTGFKDVDLTENGIKEAELCGESINTNFDIAFTSNLKRAYKTCNIICDKSNQNIEMIQSDKLNERHYGDLTGKNKNEMAKIYGEEQVQLWRRSLDVRPPGGENLLDVIDRVVIYYENEIKPYLDEGKNVLIVAHGNSIRALLVILNVFSQNNIDQFEIPTGKPIFIDYPDTGNYTFINQYEIKGRQILDSRGNPTIEADLYKDNVLIGRGTAPSGASTGSNEAIELRDNLQYTYMGKSVYNALYNLEMLNKYMYLDEKTLKNLKKCDNQMIFLDGTQLKENYGGNTTTAASFLFADAGANLSKKPLYKYLADVYGYSNDFSLPIPMVNILNGGKHAGGKLQIQEFMIMPTENIPFFKRTEYVFLVYNNLKKLLKAKYGDSSINIGDEGGFAPNLNTPDEALDIIEEAVKKSNLKLGEDITLALDCAASEFYNKETKKYTIEEGLELSSSELVDYYRRLKNRHPALISIEDAFDEQDYEGWKKINKMLGDEMMIVGDDLFTTNPDIIKAGIEEKWANSLLLKVNQIGTITEAIEAAKLMQNQKYQVIVSHRSGETNNTLISDLAVAIHATYIKLGAPARGERVAKYNRLLQIEEDI
jgi:enolase